VNYRRLASRSRRPEKDRRKDEEAGEADWVGQLGVDLAIVRVRRRRLLTRKRFCCLCDRDRVTRRVWDLPCLRRREMFLIGDRFAIPSVITSSRSIPCCAPDCSRDVGHNHAPLNAQFEALRISFGQLLDL